MSVKILTGDCRSVLRSMADESVNCIVTSPPYFGLRDYGVAGQIGLEETPESFVAELVAVFREARRVLRKDGTLWLNLGDSYWSTTATQGRNEGKSIGAALLTTGRTAANSTLAMGSKTYKRASAGLKPKDLIGVPWRVAFALQSDGWYLRSSIIWHKPNPMPESVTDRPTSAHENIFLLSRSERYFYDADAVKEAAAESVMARAAKGYRVGGVKKDASRNDHDHGARSSFSDYENGRNLRNVWTVATQPFSEWTEKTDLVPVPVSEGLELCAGDSAGGGDIARITSPDCSTHGGLSDRVPKRFYDGLSDSQLRDMRGTDGRLAPNMLSDCATTQPSSVRSPVHPSTMDSLDQQGSETAILHSSENHRTALDPSSSERAILCEEIVESTGRIEQPQQPFASIARGTVESKSAVDSSVSSCEPQSPNDSAHTSGSGSSVGSCCCRYYRKVISKQSHFATFPPALIEPCIKAGCPAGGTVLDPFGGAGTTGLVADRLGRNAVLIELNESYAQMAKRRLETDGGMFSAVELIAAGHSPHPTVPAHSDRECRDGSEPSPLLAVGGANV